MTIQSRPLWSHLIKGAACSITFISMSSANAAINLYDKDGTTFSSDGYINAFYVNNDVDRPGEQFDRTQSRVKMGFLPNYIGFNMQREMGDITLGARSSFWVTINDSETNGTSTAIDVRQFYGTVSGGFGEVLIGKDFGLFGRSNILRDELLTGFGHASDSLGLVDGGGVSFGNIGTGYPYAFPSAQITWRLPETAGFNFAAGILDPYDSNEFGGVSKAHQDAPRFESELSYGTDIGGANLYLWINGSYQTSDNTDDTVEEITSEGLGYGVQLKVADVTLTASGFDAEGVHPFLTNNAGQSPLQEIDSNGYLLQGGYQMGKARLALSYGLTEDDGTIAGSSEAEYENKSVIFSYAVNDYFNLIGNYSRFTIDDADNNELEQTDTLALGASVTIYCRSCRYWS